MSRIDVDALLARIDLHDLLGAEGVDIDTRGWGRCPLHEEKSPSFQVRERDGRQTWRCWGACGRGGDALDLLRELHGLTFREARDRLSGGRPLPASPSNPRARAPRPPAPPRRLPVADVEDLWSRCSPITTSRRACSWLVSRGLVPADVEDLDIARVLPAGGALPSWAWSGAGTWRASGHHLVVPAYDEQARLGGLRVRDVTAAAERKELAPRGQSSSGLIFMDALARRVLAGGFAPWDGLPRQLVVCEGSPDYMTWATRWGTGAALEAAPPVVGLYSGAWSDAIASRIPSGWSVVIRSHADAAGRVYAQSVAQSVAGRCPVLIAGAA
ncbi:MAG: CHC2 zinc finger domain-containing protein [Planctomycetota bacterium]